jgi:hypothetical protein
MASRKVASAPENHRMRSEDVTELTLALRKLGP